jgi:hypothetical protein
MKADFGFPPLEALTGRRYFKGRLPFPLSQQSE